MMGAANDNGFKIAYSVEEAGRALGVGHSLIWEMLASGRLERRKIGRRTVIPRSSLEALIADNPDAA